MDLKEILKKNPKLTLEILQQFQKEYDREFVDDGFKGFDKIRHTYAHMGKLFGRLAEYVQSTEDGESPTSEDIKTKVIPDLLVYASWLAREFDINLEEAYLKRVIANIKRVHKEKMSKEDLTELEKVVSERFKK